MNFKALYKSPLGDIVLEASDNYLTGLWFSNDILAADIDFNQSDRIPFALQQTKKWLDIYFSGKKPGFIPNIKPVGTLFQLAVWEKTMEIPYGMTATYKDIAKAVAPNRKMSPQAVGTALGKNKIALIIPCHRIIGTNGEMKGYAWGIDKKISLLEHERK